MLDPLAYEFAPRQPGYPELASITIARDVDRYEANARFRKSLAGNLAWFAQGATIALISFAVLFGAGAWGMSRAERAYQQEARI